VLAAMTNFQSVGMPPINPQEQAMAYNRQGIALAHQGRFAEAEEHFRYAHYLWPSAGDVCNNLANVLMFQNKLDEAIASYEQALRFLPGDPDLFNNLGHVLMKQGKVEEGINRCKNAVRLRPAFAEAHNNLGIGHEWQGQWEDAEACYRRAIELKPDFPDAWNNLGNANRHYRRLAEAVKCYRQALSIRPDFPDAERNLGLVLESLSDWAAAETCYRNLLHRHPDYVDGWNNLGNVFRQEGHLDYAVECYQRAVDMRPEYPELGLSSDSNVSWGAAETCLRRLIERRPQSPEAWNSLAAVLRQRLNFDEAVRCYHKALSLQPDFKRAHKNLGMTLLVLGRFEHAWAEYEWRWQCPPFKPRPFTEPLWDGSPLNGRTILLHAEQGLGDAIQFVRYAALVKQRGGKVVVECSSALIPLLSTCRAVDRCIASESMLPHFDTHAPLLSLPSIMNTTLATIPADVPYLFADPKLKERWRKEIGTDGGLKIGIAWQGNPRHPNDWQRSVALTRFAPLAKFRRVKLHSLQIGMGSDQLTESTDRFPIVDLGNRFQNFADTAAVLVNLDLVITVDSAVAHCAGALGVPVWVLLPAVPDWRWLLNREDSPWYPTMRLFRQSQSDSWDAVFDRLLAAVIEKTDALEGQ
jgi:tetratricopeptide (TPR) repeat protein